MKRDRPGPGAAAGGERALIERYFAGLGARRADVVLGVGDDAALVRPPPGHARSVVRARAAAWTPELPAAGGDLAHRLLAQCLLALAARGARPAWITLGISLPAPEGRWLGAFAAALDGLAREHGVALVGGDTARGPLHVTLAAHGVGEAAPARSPVRPGDRLVLVGSLAPRGPRPPVPVAETLAAAGRARAGTTLAGGVRAGLRRLLGAGRSGAVLDLGPEDPCRAPLALADRLARPLPAAALLAFPGEATLPSGLGAVRGIGVVTASPGVRVAGAPAPR